MKLKADSALNLLLVFVPIPIFGEMFGLSPTWVFVTSCLGIVPLAGLMGKATEYLAERVGVGFGALLNSTFGNACELIISIAALRAGLIDIVKASITGSIIGNVLLVVGASMLAGGMKYDTQTFNRVAATTSATLLALAAISLTVPTVFHYYCAPGAHVNETKLGLAIAIVLFISYVLGLIFSLKTHKQLYSGHEGDEIDAALGVTGWGVRRSAGVLLVATVLVAWLSECLVHAVEPAAKSLGMSKLFIGVVVVAIIGNAAEHSTAVLMAMKNKMDLALQIALGSGAQIALFVAPVLVFLSFLLGDPINLCFTELEIMSIIVSVLILAFVATDGECNWLEGSQLLAVYVILAAMFYYA
jgi:Ca2+:H+ antiporter